MCLSGRWWQPIQANNFLFLQGRRDSTWEFSWLHLCHLPCSPTLLSLSISVLAVDPYSGWISSPGLRSQISVLTEFKSYFVTTLTLTLTSYFWSRYSLIQVLRIIIKCGTQWPHIRVYEENRLEARHLYPWAQALETHSQCPWGSLVSLADASNVLPWWKESGLASQNLSTNYKIWPFIKFLPACILLT